VGCCFIECEEATLKRTVQCASEAFLQLRSPATCRKLFNAGFYFEQRNRSRPDRFRCTIVEKPERRRIRRIQHHRGYHVGIEDDHLRRFFGAISLPLKSTGRAPTSLRNSGNGSLRPNPLKRLAKRVPNPSSDGLSLTTAARRISRTSSSMLRPWRLARFCRRAFTSSSMLRTTSWAIGSLQ